MFAIFFGEKSNAHIAPDCSRLVCTLIPGRKSKKTGFLLLRLSSCFMHFCLSQLSFLVVCYFDACCFQYSETCLKGPLKNRQNKGLKIGGIIMQVESIADSAILLTNLICCLLLSGCFRQVQQKK